jgi:hypothetical protein
VRASLWNSSVERFAAPGDPGNFIKLTYNNWISFHTNITSAIWTSIAETTNERMRIDLSWNVYVWATLVHSSDRRLKENINEIGSDIWLQKVLWLQGVTYNWKDKTKDNATQYWFVAQDLEKILPDLVKTDDKWMKSVNYEWVIPVLVEAIKQQQKEIDILKNK